MRLLLKKAENIYRLATIESCERDGSIIVAIPRAGTSDHQISWSGETPSIAPVLVKFDQPQVRKSRITIHQSGTVNFHAYGRRTIHIEPLCKTTKITCIYTYIIPDIQRLDLFKETPSNGDAVLDMGTIQSWPQAFSFVVGPASPQPNKPGFMFQDRTKKFILAVLLEDQKLPIPENFLIDYKDYFSHLTAAEGIFPRQQIAEDEALIMYHQTLNNIQDTIIYHPTKDGIFKLIFATPMLRKPEFTITFTDPSIHVLEKDIYTEQRSEKVMLRFKVRNKKSGMIITKPVEMKIILDASL